MKPKLKTPVVKLVSGTRQREVADFVRSGLDLDAERIQAREDSFWQGLLDAGSELWLDTGDLEEATGLWTAQFGGLTTNNTLLNREVQKGIYDDLIRQAGRMLADLDESTRVVEIGFILNARHALRLVQRFGAKVSVELHTDLAHDFHGSLSYAHRLHEICPDRFVIKVPLTPAGLIITRKLRDDGVPVNFTLGFSARQNYLATAFAHPSFVNVFLGRLNSYVADNGLGSGEFVGEKTTLASQQSVTYLAYGRLEPTRQIAASMRSGVQVVSLAGVNVLTMPAKVAAEARQTLSGNWALRRDTTYEVALDESVRPEEVRIQKLWTVDEQVRRLADRLLKKPPHAEEELLAQAHECGCADMFPRLSAAELKRLVEEGKIPKHESWKERIARNELAVDTLLTLAGLASFAADQQALDARIRELVR